MTTPIIIANLRAAVLVLATLLGLAAAGCTDFVDPSQPMPEPNSLDQLLPIHTGNSWTYAQTGSNNGIVDRALHYLPEQPIIWTKAMVLYQPMSGYPMPIEIYTSPRSIYRVTSNGVIYGNRADCGDGRGGELIALVPRDPQPGWADARLRYEAVENITVPAGTFTAYRFASVIHEGVHYWFARGVGLVRCELNTGDGAVTTMNLTAYTVK